jgi:hypothetical protein
LCVCDRGGMFVCECALDVVGCAVGCVRVWERGQARLMDVLDSIVGALEAHRGVASVAEAGLSCMWKLSFAEANRVRRIGCLRARAALMGRGGRRGQACGVVGSG